MQLEICFGQMEVKMRGFGVQKADAEAVVQCAPIAPVVLFSG